MPKVSLIVPVYNVEDYLRKCVDSIIGQTLRDIEIILVDDGSTDNSGKICDEYAERDDRIRVIHKTNGGLSDARNAGIDVATSPFVMFIDSDDWVEPGYCELPYNEAIKNNADLVLFAYRIIREDGTADNKETGMHEGLLNKIEAYDFNVNFALAAWLGLYKKELFDNIRFPVGKLFEEVDTTHKVIHCSNIICLINTPLYNYRVGRPGSITADPLSRKQRDLKELMISKVRDLIAWGYEDYAVTIAITLLAEHGCRDKELLELVRFVRQTKSFSLPDLNLRKKLMYRALEISPTLFDALSVVTGRRK